MKIGRNKKGFTLIELIIIIIILGILAAVAIPRYLDMRQDAANATAKGVLAGLRGANSIIWGNRLINNSNATYSMRDLMGSMDIKGGIQSAFNGDLGVTLTIGAQAFVFTMNTYGYPPTTYPSVSHPTYTDW